MALLLPRAKTKQPVKIESKVEAEIEPKVDSDEVECDGIRNWMRGRIQFKLINIKRNFKQTLANVNQNKKKDIDFGFVPLFLQGSVLDW